MASPTFVIPAPKPKTPKQTPWQQEVNKRPGWKSYSTAIQNWAQVEGIDKIGLLIALTRKYGTAPTLTDAQIHTEAARLGAYVKSLGWDEGYRKYSGDKTVLITKLAPKNYVFTGGLSPHQAAVAGAEKTTAKVPFTNPYVYIDGDGNLKKWPGTTPPVAQTGGTAPGGRGPAGPKGQATGRTTVTPITYFGQPLTMSDYGQLKQHIDGIYLAYAGRRATPREVQGLLANGTTDFQLQTNLSQMDSFTRSPVWKQTAPSYLAVARQIYGEQWNPTTAEEKSLLRNAVVNNIGGSAFADQIRRLPGYVNTQEFKAQASQFSGVYRSIYGNGSPTESSTIQQAVLKGWSPQQFTDYLRALPEYTSSGEYLYKMTTLADSLGLISGRTPTVSQQQVDQLLSNPSVPGTGVPIAGTQNGQFPPDYRGMP